MSDPRLSALEQDVARLTGQLSKAHKTIASQKRDLANRHISATAHAEHIARLRRLLVNAMEDAPGWRDAAEREVKGFREGKK